MATNPQDRRSEERFAVPPHVDCSFASPVLEDFGKVKVTSISRVGVGLIASEKLAPGMLLAVTVGNRAKRFSKTVLVRVVHVTQQSGAYLVGGTFDAPFTHDELCALIM
jgi:hypothetical protein